MSDDWHTMPYDYVLIHAEREVRYGTRLPAETALGGLAIFDRITRLPSSDPARYVFTYCGKSIDLGAVRYVIAYYGTHVHRKTYSLQTFGLSPS